jgi:SAM-dependent methyltransferase
MSTAFVQLNLPPGAEEKLRCPTCLGALIQSSGTLACVSGICKKQYSIISGAPILFDEESSLYSRASVEKTKNKRPPFGKAWIERALPNLERNIVAKRHAKHFANRVLAEFPNPLILNIGGKHASAACAELRTNPAARVVELDVRPGPAATLLADPHQIPFADHSFDAVIIDAVLEHVLDPRAVVAEIWRVLRPGGLVYSDVPFMLQVHGGALDFWRFSHTGHRSLFRQFDELDSGVSQGPSVALECAILHFWLSFVRGQYARYAVRCIARLSLFWLKYLDHYLAQKPGAIDAAMGTFFIGRRLERPLPQRELLDSYRGATPDLNPVRSVVA